MAEAACYARNLVKLSPMNRPFVRSIVERFRAHTTVMSQAEVRPKTISSI